MLQYKPDSGGVGFLSPWLTSALFWISMSFIPVTVHVEYHVIMICYRCSGMSNFVLRQC